MKKALIALALAGLVTAGCADSQNASPEDRQRRVEAMVTLVQGQIVALQAAGVLSEHHMSPRQRAIFTSMCAGLKAALILQGSERAIRISGTVARWCDLSEVLTSNPK